MSSRLYWINFVCDNRAEEIAGCITFSLESRIIAYTRERDYKRGNNTKIHPTGFATKYHHTL
jgi:hypothetical protein